MKLLQWFCVGLLIIGVAAQRRQPQRPESSSVEPSTQRSVRSRGRARFTASSEFEELSNVSDPPVSQQSRQPSRRRLDYERHLEPRQRSPNTTQKPKSNGSYEVKEVIDDIPRENVRRPAPRPRISTETVSSSSAAPKTETPTSSTAREEPSTEAQKLEASTTTEKKETVDSSSIGDSETALPSTTKLFTPEPRPSSSPDTEKKQETTPELDITKEEPKRVLPRAQLKPRVNTMVEEPTEVPKTSSRLRPSRRFDVTPAPEEVPKAETPRSRTNRKRPSFVPLHERKGPSVSSVFSESDHPVRSRTGRKTKPTISRGIDSSVEATTQQRRTGLIEAAPSRRKDTSVAAENQGLNDSPAFSESDHPVRSRTGRKIEPTISRRIDSSVEEISTRIQRRTGIEAAQSRRRETVVAAENQELHDESKIASRRSPKPLARGRTFVKETSEVPPSEGTTARSSIRSRSSKRDHSSATEAPAQKTVVRNSRLRAMPHFDESKLEVLPLFESDAKTEKSTAVDSVPEVSKTTLESTSPLTTSKATEGTTSTETTKSTSKSTEATTKSTGATTKSTEATTTTTSKSRNSTNRRVVSRVPIREVKNNKIDNDPPAGRSSRKHPTTTSRITNSRSHRPRDNKPAAESSKPSSRGRGRHSSDNSESSTTEQSRRKQNRPKKIEPTVPETRLQTLSPRRSRPGSRKEPATTSTTEHSKVETRNHSSNRHATRGSSRFSKVEDELNGEIVAESNLSKSVKNLEESSTIPKRSRNTKRGTTKDHSGLTSSEEAIDESDNYPEPFKALIQAKIKQKETRSRPAEEVVTSSERIVQKNSAPKAQVLPPQSISARELRKDEDNELNALNPSPSPPKTTSRRPTSQSQRVVKTKVEIIESSNNNENKIETQTKPKASTQAPPSTSTTKEVLTSISSKVTRQRFHARFKADSKNRTAAIVNNQDDRNRNSRAKSRNLSPPKAATGLYSSKKSARSTTVAPKHESTTSSHYKRTYTSRINGVVEHVASTTEAPHNAKPKAHRFSSKYRSELLRATGFRASTAPAYVPTVPTVTPHVSTSTASGVITEENELGMEIISLDEPVKVSLLSANMIRDDLFQSTPGDKPTPPTSPRPFATAKRPTVHKPEIKFVVDDRPSTKLESLAQTKTVTTRTQDQVSSTTTSRKPINILESIINAITSTPLTPTTNSPLRSSTIFFPPKSTTPLTTTPSTKPPASSSKPAQSVQKRTIDRDSVTQTLTTEKPVSLFERIIQSLTQNSSTTARPTASTTLSTTTTKATTTTTKATTTTTTTSTTTAKPISTSTLRNYLSRITQIPKSTIIQKIPTRQDDISFGTPRSVIERILNSLSSIQSIVDTTTGSPSGERVVIITKPTQKVTKSRSTSAPLLASTTKRATSSEKPGLRSVTILSTEPTLLTTQVTSTIDPLNGFLNDIATENTLQKRTLSTLLSLLRVANAPPAIPTTTPKSSPLVAMSSTPTTTVVPTTSNKLVTLSATTAFPTTAEAPKQPDMTTGSAMVTSTMPPTGMVTSGGMATTSNMSPTTGSPTTMSPAVQTMTTPGSMAPGMSPAGEMMTTPGPMPSTMPPTGEMIITPGMMPNMSPSGEMMTTTEPMASNMSPNENMMTTSEPMASYMYPNGEMITTAEPNISPAGGMMTTSGMMPNMSPSGEMMTTSEPMASNMSPNENMMTTSEPMASYMYPNGEMMTTAEPNISPAGGMMTTSGMMPNMSPTGEMITTVGPTATDMSPAGGMMTTSGMMPNMSPTVEKMTTPGPMAPDMSAAGGMVTTPGVMPNMSPAEEMMTTPGPMALEKSPAGEIMTTPGSMARDMSPTVGTMTTSGNMPSTISPLIAMMTTLVQALSKISPAGGMMTSPPTEMPTTSAPSSPIMSTESPMTTTSNDPMQAISPMSSPTTTIVPENAKAMSTTVSGPMDVTTMTTGGAATSTMVDGTTVASQGTTPQPSSAEMSTMAMQTETPSPMNPVEMKPPVPPSFSVNINSVSVSNANDISSVEFGSFQLDSNLSVVNASGTGIEGVQSTESPVTVNNNENSVSELPFEIISTTKPPPLSSETTTMQMVDSSGTTVITTQTNDDGSTMSVETTTMVDMETSTLDISSNTIESSPAKLVTPPNNTNATVAMQNSQAGTNQIPPPGSVAPRFSTPSTVAPRIPTVSPNKDYYLFAILSNNTVVRKKPSRFPNKETPYLVIGIYPNNTIIRKFPNGTFVPEEPVIQVRGFDTRENPPDITSNQVTPDRGPASDNTITTGDDNSLQNRNNAVMPQPATPSPSNNMPAQNELNGNSVSTISNIMVQSTTGKVMYKTLQIDPLTNQVKTDRPGGVAAAGNTVFRWKPVTAPPIVEVGNKINSDINVVGSASSTPATNVVAITPSSSTTTQAAQQLATTVVNVMDQMRANLQVAVQVFATTVEPNKMTPSPTTMRPSSPAATPAPSTMMSMARGQSSTTSPPATTMKLATGPTTMAAATMMKLTTTAAPTSMASPMPSPTTAPPMTTKKPPPPPRTTPAPKPTAKSSSSSRTTAASTTTTKLPPPPPTTSALAPPTTLPPPPRTTVAPTTNPPAPTTTPARTTPMPTMPTTPVPTNPPAPPTQAPTTTIKATQVPATTFRATTQVPITTFRATTQVPSTTFRATTPILTTIFKALTQAPTTFRATTHIPTTTFRATTPILTTIFKALTQAPTTFRATTHIPTTTFRTMIQVPTTTPSPPPPARSARIRVTTTPQPTTSMRRGSRRRPTTVMTTNPPVTTPVPTTMSPVATMTTVQATTMMMTTTRPPTTTDDVTVTVTPVSIMSPEPSIQISSTTARTISSTLKTLTEEQRKNLETLAELEREQAAILKQLSFLTNLIPGGPRSLGKVPTTSRPSRQSNDIFSSLNPVQSTTKRSITTLNLLEALSPTPKKTDPHQEKLDQLLKQYNLQGVNYTPTTVQTTTKIPLTTKSQQEKLDQILKQYNLESITKKPTSTKSPSTSDSQEEKLEQLLKQYNIQSGKSSTATTTKPLTTAKLLESLSQTRSKQTSAEVDSEERVTQVLRQYNLQGVNVKTTPASITLPYGKSNDAILAAILKEQGIRPTTPKINAFEDLHLGRAVPKRTTTTPRPGMIMQGLNWLLNRLAPVQAPRPTSLQIQRPRIIFDHPETNTEEILTRQPTKLTPVLYNTPDPLPSSIIPLPSSTKRPRSLTQDLQQQEQKEVSVLLQQIQAIQKDPEAAQNIVAQFTGRPSATFRPGRRGELSPQELVVLLKEIQEIQNNPSAVKDIQAAIRSESPTTTTTTTTTTTRRPTTTKRSTSKKTLGDLNQEELSILLKQIQTIQQNPEAEQNVDLSKLLEGVRSSTPGYGDDDDEEFMMASPSIKPTRSPRLEPQRINSAQVLGVGGYEKSTSAPKALPPVSFRHVSGIADGDPQLRGRLVTAAVSVTRAISSFLGNAIQGASSAFSSLMSTSSRGLGSSSSSSRSK